MTKRLPKSFNCPTEFTLPFSTASGRPSFCATSRNVPCRYTELRKLVPKLSDKMLTERLHDLIASGLVRDVQRVQRRSTC